LWNFILINFSPGDSQSILGSKDVKISLEDDERTLTMVEDLCSEDVAGNASSLLPARLADDKDAAAAPGHTSNKGVKVNKEKVLTELEEAMA